MSKEFAYDADSKFLLFIKFSVTHQRPRVWENCRNFREKGGHLLKVKESQIIERSNFNVKSGILRLGQHPHIRNSFYLF